MIRLSYALLKFLSADQLGKLIIKILHIFQPPGYNSGQNQWITSCHILDVYPGGIKAYPALMVHNWNVIHPMIDSNKIS